MSMPITIHQCSTCKFWYWDHTEIGDCRRYPPSMRAGTKVDGFPKSFGDYWCGEYKQCHEEEDDNG